jgi:hypothetical protein
MFDIETAGCCGSPRTLPSRACLLSEFLRFVNARARGAARAQNPFSPATQSSPRHSLFPWKRMQRVRDGHTLAKDGPS